MKYLASPVILALILVAFCAYSWHSVETGLNKELRQEIVTLKETISTQAKENEALTAQVDQFKADLIAALPEQSKEIDALFATKFGKEAATEEQVATEGEPSGGSQPVEE